MCSVVQRATNRGRFASSRFLRFCRPPVFRSWACRDDPEAAVIPIHGLPNTAEGAIAITLPYTRPENFKLREGETEKLECVYYDHGASAFKTDGCTLVSHADGEATCRCTHLTDFALWLRVQQENQAEVECLKSALNPKDCESSSGTKANNYVQLWVAVINLSLALIVCLKLACFTFPNFWRLKTWAEARLRLSVTDYQCALVLLNSVVRGSVAAWKYQGGMQDSDPIVSGVVVAFAMALMFWSATLTIANWATIIHHVIKRGSKSPIAGIAPYYICSNLILVAFIISCWIGIILNRATPALAEPWVKAGETGLAVPELLIGVAALFYGTKLIMLIRRSMSEFSSDDTLQKQRQLVACRNTALIAIAFSLLFSLSAALDLLSAWNSADYFAPSNALGGQAPLDLLHELSTILTNIIIVFVVVKYEEVTSIANTLFVAPMVNIAHRFSKLFNEPDDYTRVPTEDLENTRGNLKPS